MNVLVTGCAGFIGSHVAAHALDAGHTVVGIDSFNDAYDIRLKDRRLANLATRPGFRLHRVDIADKVALGSALAGEPFDAIMNLAARAGVRYSLEDPWEYLRTNAEGTLNLLEWARKRDVRKVVLASTSSLYGDNTPRPFREDAPTDRPMSPYAASKKAAEALVASYAHLYGMDAPVLRYFTVYGPAGRPDMAVFRFVQRIREGRPIVVYGDGSAERDFTYVDDIARGTLAALDVRGNEIINLGNDRPSKVSELIQTIEAAVGKQARIERRAKHPADVQATWASIEKARKLLGWEPQVGLLEGIRRTAAWYEGNRAWAQSIDDQA